MCRTQIKNLLVGGFWIFAHITGKDGTQLEIHRWSMEIESGGYSRPGYSQLGERGQVEPDK